ncbi:uncharacterized protein LOC119404563 [Rhipicephalus sanguineus]|uniref:uncharacterized protein LOC119404563 n=1 Tax=Rhipicephalus sanguineus TaxID=34632 RepID=UPI0018950DA7|nr:uncharacterized protein LOC119404563 [Rhipicephalus sanguineus]
MSLNGTLLCLVQVFLGFGAFECAQPLYASCGDTSQLISKGPPFSTLSSPHDAVLLAFPFKHHSVTSSFGAAIKEHRHDFVFCGHGGPKAAMSLNGTLLCLVQGTPGYTAGVLLVGCLATFGMYWIFQMVTLLVSICFTRTSDRSKQAWDNNKKRAERNAYGRLHRSSSSTDSTSSYTSFFDDNDETDCRHDSEENGSTDKQTTDAAAKYIEAKNKSRDDSRARKQKTGQETRAGTAIRRTNTKHDMSDKDILRFCRQEQPTTFGKVLGSNRKKAPKFVFLGEGSTSNVYTDQDTVLKIMTIPENVDARDDLIRKLKKRSTLSDLRNNYENSTTGFIEIRRTWFVIDTYPEELLESQNQAYYQGRARCLRMADRQPQKYLVCEEEFAGVTLDKVRIQKPLVLYSILMQLSLTISAAEGAVEFEHRSRLQKCVYVRKPSHKEACLFRLRYRTYSSPTFGIVVRLKCGTATRCKKGTKVLFSPLMDPGRGDLNDDEREALRMINTLIGQDITGFHPRTNLAWLVKLTESTMSKNEGYIIGRPSGRESLETLDLWMEHLLLSDSVADSIDSLFDADS